MLRFLLIFILVLIVLQFVGRIFFQWFIKRTLERQQQNNSGTRGAKKGDIYVTVNKKEEKNVHDGVGEYVDFEELK